MLISVLKPRKLSPSMIYVSIDKLNINDAKINYILKHINLFNKDRNVFLSKTHLKIDQLFI